MFPKEAWGYLLGNEALDCVEISDLWLPEDVEKYSTPSTVNPPKHWPIKALEYCEEHDITALGSIHSHPYSYSETHVEGRRVMSPDHSTSENDALSGITTKLHGICRVTQSKTGRLRATIKLWGPELPVTEEIV